jgi:hypothetical protein
LRRCRVWRRKREKRRSSNPNNAFTRDYHPTADIAFTSMIDDQDMSSNRTLCLMPRASDGWFKLWYSKPHVSLSLHCAPFVIQYLSSLWGRTSS